MQSAGLTIKSINENTGQINNKCIKIIKTKASDKKNFFNFIITLLTLNKWYENT